MIDVVEKLIKASKTISTMESCTGGAIASEITSIPGASECFMFGVVTYSNHYKIKMGVSEKTIAKYTVYSREVAREMASVISSYTDSSYGIGITGKFNKADPNNLTGDNSTVFISIYDKDNNKYYDKDITVSNSDRVTNKREVIEVVILMLREILEL